MRGSCPDSGDHGWDAQGRDDAVYIVAECCQAELGADVVEPSHQERSLAPPLFDRAERVLHAFTPLA